LHEAERAVTNLNPSTGIPDRFRVGERVRFNDQRAIIREIRHNPGHTLYIARVEGCTWDSEFLAADLRRGY